MQQIFRHAEDFGDRGARRSTSVNAVNTAQSAGLPQKEPPVLASGPKIVSVQRKVIAAGEYRT